MPIIKKISNHLLEKEGSVLEPRTPSIAYLAKISETQLLTENTTCNANDVLNFYSETLQDYFKITKQNLLKKFEVLTVNGSYTILETDLGKSIRVLSATTANITLPQMVEDNDGSRLRIGKISSGTVNILAPSGYSIAGSNIGTALTNNQEGETHAFVDLEYVHSNYLWRAIEIGAWIYS